MRKFNRRQDLSSARVVAEGIRLYRSLGYTYGVQHLLAQQIPPGLARGLLAVGFDRRERERRSARSAEQDDAVDAPVTSGLAPDPGDN